MTTDTSTRDEIRAVPTEPAATDSGIAAQPRRPITARTVLAVGAATAAAFVLSAAWYIAFADPYQALLGADATADSSVPVWLVFVELGRSLLVAIVLAVAVQRLAISTRAGALLFALVVWAAFPVVLLLGSVVHEGVPPLLAAIHAGDWLLKLVVITMVVRRLGARRSTSLD